MTSTAYFADYMGVKLHKMAFLVIDSPIEVVTSFNVFPYGGVI